LLNPRDAFTLRVILTAPGGWWEPEMSMRIANITEYSKPPILVRLGLSPDDSSLVRKLLFVLVPTWGTYFFAIAAIYFASVVINATVSPNTLFGRLASFVLNISPFVYAYLVALPFLSVFLIAVLVLSFRIWLWFDNRADERKHPTPQPRQTSQNEANPGNSAGQPE
jgi:hypothetical protein